MKKMRWLGLVAIACGPMLWAQGPQVHSDPIGFSYNLPDDWEAVTPKPTPAAEAKLPANAPAAERTGTACVQVPLTARHGNPQSDIVVVALPFDCFGQTMTEQDLPGFGSGVTEGLKRTFTFATPISATYEQGSHKLWVERVKATPLGKTAPVYTIEIACTILEKGAVCWMAQAADAEALDAFEHSAVALEGAAPGRLVPADAFVKSH